MSDQKIILDVTTTDDQNDGSSFQGIALKM